MTPILWDHKAEHFVTSSSSDPSISVHDGLSPSSSPPTILRHHQDGVTALALSHDSAFLASGSIDHCVKLYKFPSGEFQTNITRFTLPIRVLAFNGSGSLLAAAGDDEGIKLINTIDGSIVRVLKGHNRPVTGLDFNPNGELLASLDSTGTVLCWELQNGIVSYTLKGVAPDTGFSTSVVNILRWSPDGRILAVPGLRNDVVMYDRFTGEKLFALRDDHLEAICYLTWAPNGKYIATSGLDKQVLLWDVNKKQDIDRQKFEERIRCMAWKPNCNALSVIDVRGKYGIWESLVPSSMVSPTEGIPDILPKRRNEILIFDEDMEEELSESLNDARVESDDGESHQPSRKRLRRNGAIQESTNKGMDVLDVDDIDLRQDQPEDVEMDLNQPKDVEMDLNQDSYGVWHDPITRSRAKAQRKLILQVVWAWLRRKRKKPRRIKQLGLFNSVYFVIRPKLGLVLKLNQSKPIYLN